MTTSEPEITELVNLCTPDGRSLNPAARGWSRAPMHLCSLRGGWGRTKRWDYWGILAGDLAIAATYADVDYLGIANVWWCDLPSGRTGGRDGGVPLARGFGLPDLPGTTPLRYSGKGLDLTISDDDEGTHIRARWSETDGSPGRLDATVALPAGHESLNVVIPWSDTQFQYTSKHQARPASGILEVAGEMREFGGDDCWGVLDVGRGRWPYRTNWNWGGGAGRATDGKTVVGLQLGGKWTAGTGFTENGLIVDGRLTKVGDELRWDYDWAHPLRPWRVTAPDGSIDLTLTPRYDKHTKINALVMGMEVHQVFGHWSGTVTPDGGEAGGIEAGTTEPIELDGIQGFAEESRSRW